MIPRPEDTPPAYTYPPPLLPMGGNEHATEVHHRLYATAVAVLIVAVLAIAIYFSFFNHSKV